MNDETLNGVRVTASASATPIGASGDGREHHQRLPERAESDQHDEEDQQNREPDRDARTRETNLAALDRRRRSRRDSPAAKPAPTIAARTPAIVARERTRGEIRAETTTTRWPLISSTSVIVRSTLVGELRTEPAPTSASDRDADAAPATATRTGTASTVGDRRCDRALHPAARCAGDAPRLEPARATRLQLGHDAQNRIVL